MRLNIAFFVVSFAAAVYALPMADVSNTNASVADGRAGAVLPRENSDGFLQSNSVPLESPTSGPPRSSISSRGASQTEQTSPEYLEYKFLGLEGKTEVRDAGLLASQANQLAEELIRKYILPGNDLLKLKPKLKPSNKFLGNPGEFTFEVDLRQYGMGECKAEILIDASQWFQGHITVVDAKWNGKEERYIPDPWKNSNFA